MRSYWATKHLEGNHETTQVELPLIISGLSPASLANGMSWEILFSTYLENIFHDSEAPLDFLFTAEQTHVG